MKHTPEEIFYRHFIPEPNSGCWLWTSNIIANGYGTFSCGGHYYRAHRFSWQHHIGQIPAGLCVCHKCDVRSCCNPDHLFLGTNAENVADKVQKGRAKTKSQWGETNGQAKLTAAKVQIIRTSGKTLREMANEFGVSESTISRIRNGQLWSAA